MSSKYTAREELLHSITHGAGAALSIVGLILMVVYSAKFGDAWHVVSTAIYGACLVLLYLFSTLYHATVREPLKELYHKLDHAAIFLLIAGTYTPLMLITLRGSLGLTLLAIVWAIGISGVILKFYFTGRFRHASTLIYLGMGWIVMIAVKPLMAALPGGGFKWLLAGGLCYTIGCIFYSLKRFRYTHTVWHLWVLSGSVCHWVVVFRYVVPSPAA